MDFGEKKFRVKDVSQYPAEGNFQFEVSTKMDLLDLTGNGYPTGADVLP